MDNNIGEAQLKKALNEFRDSILIEGKMAGAKEFAEIILDHYPHTISIRNTIVKELSNYINKFILQEVKPE